MQDQLFSSIGRRLYADADFRDAPVTFENVAPVPWCSTTFIGERITFDLCILAGGRVGAQALAARAGELLDDAWEADMPDFILVDIALASSAVHDREARLRFEALTVDND